MIFNLCAMRAIVTAVTLLAGLLTQPILFDQAPLLSSGTNNPPLMSDLQMPSLDRLSLEWSLFKPNNGICAKVDEVPIDQLSPLQAENVVQSNFTYISPVFNASDLFSNISLDQDQEFILTAMIPPNKSFCFHEVVNIVDTFADNSTFQATTNDVSVDNHTIRAYYLDFLTSAFSETGRPFEPYSPQPDCVILIPALISEPELEQHLMELKLEYSCLVYLKELKCHVHELLLSSLPTNWTTNNRLTLGLICVTVMYGSLFCPILYYFWTQKNAKKTLTSYLNILKVSKLSAESKLSSMDLEKNVLEQTTHLHEQELQELKMRLERCNLLETETLERLVLAKEELKKETMDTSSSIKHIHSEHLKLLTKVKEKLQDTNRKLAQFQTLESEAQLKLTSVEKQLDEERREWDVKEDLIMAAITELWQELHDTKRRNEAFESEGQDASKEPLLELCDEFKSEEALLSIQATEKRLRLATNKIVKLKMRLSDTAVMNDFEIDGSDSGIFLSCIQ